jgi:hypothetical protein
MGSLWNDTYASYRDGIFLNSRPVGPAGLFPPPVGANTSCADFSACAREKGVRRKEKVQMLSFLAQRKALSWLRCPVLERPGIGFVLHQEGRIRRR